ncbi:MAG: 50S ribosomal protein L23 [bacterium]
MKKEPYQIVQSLLVTEKGTALSVSNRQYVFRVATDANKIEISRAVEALFSVKVAAVNVMNLLGKLKRMRSAKAGRRADWRKAVVTLKEGKIDIL